jgi:hypothetical protein
MAYAMSHILNQTSTDELTPLLNCADIGRSGAAPLHLQRRYRPSWPAIQKSMPALAAGASNTEQIKS